MAKKAKAPGYTADADVTDLQFGFDFGPARVVRLMSDPRYGVWIDVAGRREHVEIRVTNSGLVRVSKPRRVGPEYFKTLGGPRAR